MVPKKTGPFVTCQLHTEGGQIGEKERKGKRRGEKRVEREGIRKSRERWTRVDKRGRIEKEEGRGEGR